MNLLLFTERDRIAETRITILGRRLEHLRRVHRAIAGDTLRVGEIGGMIGEARILEIDDQAAVLDVTLNHPPPEKLPLSLVLALPRPKMLRRILRNIAEFGVGELHLINSYRVEKSYWQSPVLADANAREYLLQGLEQARDTRIPVVVKHKRFKVFVEDVLPGMVAGKTALLAHPGDHALCPQAGAGETVLVIGPEGGFIPYEISSLQASGCETVSLGTRILRVENALTYALGKLF